MRSTVQIIFCAITDNSQPVGANIVQYQWVLDVDDAAAYFAAVYPGYDPTLFSVLQEQWYVNLSKSNLQNILNAASPIVRSSPQLCVAERKVWNSNQPGFSISPRVDGALPGTKPVSQKAKAGSQQMSLFGYLDRLRYTWSTPGLPPPAVLAPKRWIDWLTRLIDDYQNAKVTASQVYAFLAQVDFAARTIKIP